MGKRPADFVVKFLEPDGKVRTPLKKEAKAYYDRLKPLIDNALEAERVMSIDELEKHTKKMWESE